MNRVVTFLNNRVLVAIVVGLMLLGIIRTFARR